MVSNAASCSTIKAAKHSEVFLVVQRCPKATKWACNATAPGNATVLILSPRRRIPQGTKYCMCPSGSPSQCLTMPQRDPTVLPTLVRYFVLVPGAINLVQSPSYFDKLLDMGCPSRSLFLAGHWVSSDLCINAVPDSKDGHSFWSKVDVVVLPFLLLSQYPQIVWLIIIFSILVSRQVASATWVLRASAQYSTIIEGIGGLVRAKHRILGFLGDRYVLDFNLIYSPENQRWAKKNGFHVSAPMLEFMSGIWAR